MSNILSLEELTELHDQHYNDPDDTILQLCETAIEYYRRWQALRDGIMELPWYEVSAEAVEDGISGGVVSEINENGEWVLLEDIEKLLNKK